MIIRTPTRTKTKSFKGEQMDFKFPSNNSSEFESHDEVELNNHFLVNESLRNDKNQIIKEKNLVTPLISHITSQPYSSKGKNLNVDLSNAYYSFANISDNTTSPSFFHEKRDSETNSDIISMLNINGNPKLPTSEYPHTLAPKKTVRDFSLVESIITPITSPPSSSLQQHHSLSPKMKSPSIKSNKTVNTTPTDIPTADNLSYDIISSSSLSCLNSSKLESLRLPSSSSSSDFSSKEALHSASSTVKRTPMNLYRKPTMRKVDSIEFSSVSSDKNSNKSKYNENDLHYDNIKSKLKSKPNTNNNNENNSRNNKINNNKPVRRMSSMRSHPKSTLKRSKAIRCKGGLLRYFEMIGVRIKKLMKQIRLLLFKKRTVNNYQSKNFSMRRSFSSISSTNDHQILLTKNKRNKKLRINTKSKNTNHATLRRYHIPNSSSLQALQPALIEKVKPVTIDERHTLKVNTNKDSINDTETANINNKNYENTNIKSPNESIVNSPLINNQDTITTAASITITKNNNNSNSVPPFIGNRDSTRTNSTLRRTNSSIRRAASILTASTPSTSTYYSAVTCQDNGSPVRKSKLIKSVASTSLSSLVRQPSIVVKNKVIPLSMSVTYSMNETNDNDTKYSSPLMEDNVLDTFDTIKEEDEEDEKEKLSAGIIDSDSDSSIFTELGTNVEDTTESINNNNNNNIGTSLEAKNEGETEEDSKEEINEINKKGQKTSVVNKKEDEKYKEDNDMDHTYIKEEMTQLMKTYLSQIIQKRILMRLQMVKFQESNIMEPEYKQMIDDIVSDYETECHENFMVIDNSENDDESDTSSSVTSSGEYNDSLSKFNQLITTTNVDGNHENDIDGNEKSSPISLQYPSKDVLFGMNTLMRSNREKVLNIPASTIKRSMTLPIGMKI